MTETTATRAVPMKRHSPVVTFFYRLVKEKPMGTVGAVLVILLFLVGIFADLLAPYEYNDTDMKAVLEAPSVQHWLGTDNVGRDVLSRVIYGARISMIVGLAASALDAIIATLIGVISGYFGGKVDLVIQRFVDAVIAFPSLFFYLSVMAIVGPGLVQVIFVLGILQGIGSSRLIRSAVIGTRNNVYIEAARSLGASNTRILLRHILPNVMAPIIIIFTISMGGVIIAEASLSFLGLGIPAPMPSWGGMLSGAGRRYMMQAPWLVIWPGLALSLAVYGINMFGDALRDLFDPRLRGGVGGLGEYAARKVQKELEKRQAKLNARINK
ncbi:MAG: ABC transporter permease [Dehalococcoidales bacterium]|nr:ABC transporter permease [Dehalococcoidales bacterium]